MASQSYTGESLKERPVEIQKTQKDGTVITEILQPYFPDPELVKTVNIALLLNRPLLVMGEPGCGKSLLAKAIAYEWYDKHMYQANMYYEWNIKSTSKAIEGLYEFDHLRRLRDTTYDKDKVDDIKSYIEEGPLALAMERSNETQKAVLLIDEIDKADIDFSNDLLNELERNSYQITESKETKSFPYRPFIIITSNSEKDLSDAFLRRCIFHYIDLFSKEKLETEEPKNWLRRIVQARYYNTEAYEPDAEMITMAINTFVTLRQRMNADTLTYRKTVSTSEFLDWFSILKRCYHNGLLEGVSPLSNDFKEWLNKTNGKVPFGNALFKTTKSLMDLSTAKS